MKAEADPNCSQCKGSGHYEVDRDKRLALDRVMDDMLEKFDVMEAVGISEEVIDSMSDEEFEDWTFNTDSSHLIEKSERLRKSKALKTEKRNIEFAKMEEGNKIARRKLRQIRRNLNSFEI